MIKIKNIIAFSLCLLLVIFTACSDGGGVDSLTEGLSTLNIIIAGEGEIAPNEGVYDFEEDTIVDISAKANEGWEFYAWTGENTDGIADVQEEETTIKMNDDKEIIAFFAREDDDYFELEIDERFFMGAEGQGLDLAGHPPYPEGFEVRVKAEPEDEDKYAFLHWGVEFEGEDNFDVDPRDYFEDHEAQETTFKISRENKAQAISENLGNEKQAQSSKRKVIVIPHFTTTGSFDFDHNDFGITKSGGVGLTIDYWDISSLNEGAKVDFSFTAYHIPDRFTVYYGNERVFASGWVSNNPSGDHDSQLYPGGIRNHNWHSNVNGGRYSSIIEKKEGRDEVRIEVEGRDNGTAWRYTLDATIVDNDDDFIIK